MSRAFSPVIACANGEEQGGRGSGGGPLASLSVEQLEHTLPSNAGMERPFRFLWRFPGESKGAQLMIIRVCLWSWRRSPVGCKPAAATAFLVNERPDKYAL